MTTFTLKMIRESFEQKREWEKQFPINYYIVRPASFYLTYIAIKITQNPAKIALFGFVIGIIACLFLACASIFSIWTGIILVALYSLFDAVDGNVARTTKNVTLFGKYIDGLFGNIIDGAYLFFLGIGQYFSWSRAKYPVISEIIEAHANTLPLFLGSLILISKLWASHFRSYHEQYIIKKEGLKPVHQLDIDSNTKRPTHSNRWDYRLFINLDCLNNQLLLLTICIISNRELWFLIIFAFFYVIKAIFFSILYYKRTKERLVETNLTLQG